MKKRFLILIVLVVLTLTSGVAFGSSQKSVKSDKNPIVKLKDISVEETTKDFTEQNRFFYESGFKRSKKKKGEVGALYGVIEYINLNVPKYYQNGETWSSHIMQTEGLSIGGYGCALTSFTMVANYFGTTTHNPGQVNSTLGNYACPLYWSQAGAKYGLTLTGHVDSPTLDYAKSYILGALRNNKPTIICFKKGSTTHFVVAYAYILESYTPEEGAYGREFYYIRDPNRYKDYTTIDNYLNDGWYIRSLRVFSK